MDKLTIKEAAIALNVSMQTVRRRIAKNEIPAKKELTAYGEMWYIPKSFIDKAIQTVDVVPINKNISSSELKQIIAEEMNPLREEIRQLRLELEAHNRKVDEQLRLSISPQVKKGFWSKIFG